jgi:hypothetical protein
MDLWKDVFSCGNVRLLALLRAPSRLAGRCQPHSEAWDPRVDPSDVQHSSIEQIMVLPRWNRWCHRKSDHHECHTPIAIHRVPYSP